ncbi:hypothetical protein PR003_g6952 [Phytophthora rubi]|uniref:Crinkler effector protein N-terminal domain-containing protein n=1 Tax=Phytophthora rubi TaxID=129364 RepID=A0A6A4FVA4_9STRA|nr:hypothetical protein PR002_g6941 [Phytophthora rubi]KAE9041567.1 hypothetical protein PR001_g6553 [Phytophthora rubi]KAE9347405.1 hypothetical protein PR003_g6952 [Phytophthora rubi]
MVKVMLTCAFVGGEGSSFDVQIKDGEKVSKLKKKIKHENQNKLKTVDAKDLQLFLAKATDGAWLWSRSEDVKKLKKGERTALIEALTQGDGSSIRSPDPRAGGGSGRCWVSSWCDCFTLS